MSIWTLSFVQTFLNEQYENYFIFLSHLSINLSIKLKSYVWTFSYQIEEVTLVNVLNLHHSWLFFCALRCFFPEIWFSSNFWSLQLVLHSSQANCEIPGILGASSILLRSFFPDIWFSNDLFIAVSFTYFTSKLLWRFSFLDLRGVKHQGKHPRNLVPRPDWDSPLVNYKWDC